MKEKKHRVEDALQATRAALEEGIVAGGGVALLNAADTAKKGFDVARGRREDRARRSSSARPEEPVRQLAYNAGLEGSVVVNQGPLGEEGLRPERRLG